MNFIRMAARRMPPTVSPRWAMRAAWLASANARQEFFAEHWRARLDKLRDWPAVVEKLRGIRLSAKEMRETIDRLACLRLAESSEGGPR